MNGVCTYLSSVFPNVCPSTKPVLPFEAHFCNIRFLTRAEVAERRSETFRSVKRTIQSINPYKPSVHFVGRRQIVQNGLLKIE